MPELTGHSVVIKKARAAAWLAAVGVHTSLTNVSLAGVALDLFTTREREIHDASVRQSTTFFDEAAARHLHLAIGVVELRLEGAAGVRPRQQPKRPVM